MLLEHRRMYPQLTQDRSEGKRLAILLDQESLDQASDQPLDGLAASSSDSLQPVAGDLKAAARTGRPG